MPIDVMARPNHEEEAALAAMTTTATKFYYYHSAERKAAAREALRHATEYDFYRKEDGSADCALEQIWNALVGND